MRLSRVRSGAALAGFVVLVATVGGFVAEERITTHAFDRLEADQVAQDAQRVRSGLEADVRLLSNYGATNSIWDSSYDDVAKGDREAFASDFPPADVRGIYGLDGVLAVSRTGELRAGGLVADDAFAAPPQGLAAPADLARLVDVGAKAGVPRCGLVRTATSPYLFCGFAAHKGDGGADVAGGLIFLRALDAGGLKRLGDELSLPLALVTGAAREGLTRQPTVDTSLGRMDVDTVAVDGQRVALDVRIPAVDGTAGPDAKGSVRLEALRPRPIHGQAVAVSQGLLGLMALIGVTMLAAVLAITRREVRLQVGPLRRTTEQVIRSGDRTLRIGGDGRGELGALARAVDAMLDALADQDRRIFAEQATRESQLRHTYVQQRLTSQQVRHRAQVAIDETATAVVHELQEVAREVAVMESTVASIDDRVRATEQLTQAVREQAVAGGRTAEAVTESLGRVSGIARMIAGVAAQTNLLSLNATIEAARAGAAGAGFAVVAGEVKQLASTTTASTDEIGETLGGLENDVSAMAGAIGEMTDGVGGIRAEAAELAQVAAQQRAQMEVLDEVVRRVMDRISGMSAITKAIERRAHERVRAEGEVQVRHEGRLAPGALLDLSEGGLRCLIDPVTMPKQGDLVEVVLSLEGRSETFAAAVVRTPKLEDDGVELGLTFRDPSPAGMRLVLDYIEAVLGAEADRPVELELAAAS